MLKASENLFGEGTGKDKKIAPPPEKSFLERMFSTDQRIDQDCILVSEYTVTSKLYLAAETSKNTMEGLGSHVMRLERYIPAGRHLDTEKRHFAGIADFDGFMRGNPYPRMYVKQ